MAVERDSVAHSSSLKADRRDGGAVSRSATGITTLSATTLIGPATIIVVVLLVAPLLILFRYSLNRFVPGKFMVDALTVENYVKVFVDPYYRAVLLRTGLIAALCTALCLVLGYPAAYLLARTRSRFKTWLVLLVVMPLFIGNAVRAAGWMVVFGRQGAFNATLTALGIVDAPLDIMYTPLAVIVGITGFNLPFMVLTLQSVIEGIDPALEEAALGMGARPLRAFSRVTLPLSLPGVVAGSLLCFILAMNAYANPVLLGGPRFQMKAPVVYTQIAGQSNWPLGGALAFVLMTATLALTVSAHAMVQRRYRRRGIV
jgi:putative spermidine/putrescine transport system permease protein